MLDLITIPSFGSANLIEILWTLSGVTGLAITVPNTWYAIDKISYLSDLREEDRGAARFVLFGRVRREFIRAFKCITVILVGVYFMATPSPQSMISTGGLLITIVFLMIGAESGVQSYLDKREGDNAREALLQQARQRE